VLLLLVIGCPKWELGDVLGVPRLQVPHEFRQAGGTSVTERPRAALRTFSPVAKVGGSQIVGPHPSDRQMELADMSELSSTVLRDGTCGCCTPVPLIGCDGDGGSILVGPRYDSILSGDAPSTRDRES